jgi:hypothetical protein
MIKRKRLLFLTYCVHKNDRIVQFATINIHMLVSLVSLSDLENAKKKFEGFLFYLSNTLFIRNKKLVQSCENKRIS